MDIFKKLGVKTVINARGHGTGLSNSVLSEESIEAMCEAARVFVDLHDLRAKAGVYVAKLIGAPAACITSGAASALVLAGAACIAGKDLDKIQRLPVTEGLKNEIIIQKAHVSVFSQNLKMAGAKLVEIGIEGAEVEPWTLECAITDKTAAVCYVTSEHAIARTSSPLLSLEEMTKTAHKHHLPVIVDAAPQQLSDIRKSIGTEVDLIAWSGGKSINGPGATGLLLGRKDLIEAAEMHCGLHPKAVCQGVGRPMKVGKEEIAALVSALEMYVNEDYQTTVKKEFEERNKYIEKELRNVHHIKTVLRKTEDTIGPILHLEIDEKAIGLSAADIIYAAENGNPSVMLGKWGAKEAIIQVNVETLQKGEEKIVAEKLKEILLHDIVLNDAA